jgi:hypothetical protein
VTPCADTLANGNENKAATTMADAFMGTPQCDNSIVILWNARRERVAATSSRRPDEGIGNATGVCAVISRRSVFRQRQLAGHRRPSLGSIENCLRLADLLAQVRGRHQHPV